MNAPHAPNPDVDFDTAVLGGGLPENVQTLITQAGLLRSEPDKAEALLFQARALAPTHPATLIALYRFYFYGQRLLQARDIAKQSMDVGLAALGDDWLPHDDLARFDATTRFYLFALKGYAYLSLRLGDIEAGRQALSELRQLDPQDRVGGGLLSHVLTRSESQSPLGDGQVEPIAHRGWGPT